MGTHEDHRCPHTPHVQPAPILYVYIEYRGIPYVHRYHPQVLATHCVAVLVNSISSSKSMWARAWYIWCPHLGPHFGAPYGRPVAVLGGSEQPKRSPTCSDLIQFGSYGSAEVPGCNFGWVTKIFETFWIGPTPQVGFHGAQMGSKLGPGPLLDPIWAP